MAEKQSEIDRIPPLEDLEASKLPRTISKCSKRYKKTRPEFSGTSNVTTDDDVRRRPRSVFSNVFPERHFTRDSKRIANYLFGAFRYFEDSRGRYRRVRRRENVWRPPAISLVPESLREVRWNRIGFIREFRKFPRIEFDEDRRISSAATNSKNRKRKRSRVLKFETISRIFSVLELRWDDRSVKLLSEKFEFEEWKIFWNKYTSFRKYTARANFVKPFWKVTSWSFWPFWSFW